MKILKTILIMGLIISIGFFLYFFFVCQEGVLGCLGSMQNLFFPLIGVVICTIGLIIIKIISIKK